MTNRREYFDNNALAAWYDTKYNEMGGTWVTPPEECNRHLDSMGVRPDVSKWLLDIGCGGGHFIEQAAKRVNCVGLEISRVAAAYARERLWEHETNPLLSIAYIIERPIEQFSSSIRKFDWITSMGSLEHVLHLDEALDNINALLRPDGRFYFYLPNTKWIHKDQPNELLADEGWWADKLAEHGLFVKLATLWGVDNIAYQGTK